MSLTWNVVTSRGNNLSNSYNVFSKVYVPYTCNRERANRVLKTFTPRLLVYVKKRATFLTAMMEHATRTLKHATAPGDARLCALVMR